MKKVIGLLLGLVAGTASLAQTTTLSDPSTVGNFAETEIIRHLRPTLSYWLDQTNGNGFTMAY